MEVDGGGLLCVHADDVAAGLDEVTCAASHSLSGLAWQPDNRMLLRPSSVCP